MVEKRTLCDLEKDGVVTENLKYYKKLVHRGKYVCKHCGRVARKKRNLCKPGKL